MNCDTLLILSSERKKFQNKNLLFIINIYKYPMLHYKGMYIYNTLLG